jgi:DHA1 family bicyclomycin/chloramphenicol resistance-like MFS transporter
MVYLLMSFFGIGLLFGNLTALAMQPLGHIAGTGAAVVGATSMLSSLAFGTVIGQSYNGTVLPLVLGFAVLSACSIATARWAESGNPVPHDAAIPAVDPGMSDSVSVED